MNHKRIIAGLVLIGSVIIISAFVKPEDDPLSRIAQHLYDWTTAHPQEKVYLQLDKPYYAIGDDVWFKAYVTTGSLHQLSLISGVLNVELIDERDSVKQSFKLPILSGLSWGSLSLTDSLKEGNYRIRAYTNYMRNAGSDYYFDKNIVITNSITNSVFTNTTYKYSTQNAQQKVDAAISYTDLNGDPYINKPVSYQVQLNAKTTTRGHGVTDDKGVLNISFTSNAAAGFTHGHIITDIKIADKRTIEKSVLIKAVSNNVDVQFFPEGGNLVYGNDSKIAFKAVGADGLGADVKGVIVDDNDKQAASFASTHLGMGVFNLKPENGHTYKAKLTYADGSVAAISLPQAVATGYSFSVDNSDADIIGIKIIPGAAVSTSMSETEVMSLIGQSGGTICYAAKSKPGSKYFTTQIAKSKFPTGIVQFTLFNSAGEPLNERLVFVENHDELKLGAATEKQSYAPRQKVSIELSSKNKDDKPTIGSFSVSVTDENKVPFDETTQGSILSDLLLTSDLKGYIENPGYYFNADDAKTQADMDVLMLTQGYHRFEWKQVLSNNQPANEYGAEKTLQITGHLKTLGGKPVPNGKVILFYTKAGFFMVDTVSDSEGRFTFKNLIFKDSTRFLIQARTAKDRKNIDISLDDVPPLYVSKSKNSAGLLVNISTGLSPYLQNSKSLYNEQLKHGIPNTSIQLKEVVIKERKIEPVISNSANLNGPGNADQIIKADELSTMACANIADCLQGRLLGVIFRNGIPYSTRSPNQPMAIVLDGSIVSTDFLNDLNAANIGSIEVLRSIGYTAIYGGQGGGGVLVITSKTGADAYSYQHYAPGIITYMPKGYVKMKEFYSPRYDNPDISPKIADLRSTIYWNPHVLTGKDGKATFDFFNADSKGTYRVTIEGIDDEGNLGRKVYRYKVE